MSAALTSFLHVWHTAGSSSAHSTVAALVTRSSFSFFSFSASAAFGMRRVMRRSAPSSHSCLSSSIDFCSESNAL
jgi:hypothetical protein